MTKETENLGPDKRTSLTKSSNHHQSGKAISLTKSPCQHKYWLQRNRIDAVPVCHSVSVMKQIKIEETTSMAPFLCQHCGGVMRLIGSEPHPVEAKTDLLTYCCTAC